MARVKAADPELAQILVEAMPTGLIHARDEVIVYCNEAFARLLGSSPERIVGRNLFEFVIPALRESARARYVARQSGEAVPSTWEIDLLREDGRLVRAEIEPRAIGPGEHLVLARDTTGALRDIELSKRLSNVALRLQRERSEDAVLRACARGLHELGMRLHALELRGEELVLRLAGADEEATSRLSRRKGRDPGSLRIPLRGVEILERLFAERRPIYLDDVSELVRRAFAGDETGLGAIVGSLLQAQGVRKAVLAPLFVSDGPWGALLIGADLLTPRDGATVALFAAQVASAMEVVRTITELDRSNRGLRAVREVARAGTEHELAAILPRLLEIAATTTGSDRAAIFLADEARQELVLVGQYGPSSSAFDGLASLQPEDPRVAEAFEAKRPIELSLDEGNVREALVVPLGMQGRKIGLLCVGRLEPRPYGEEEIAVAEPLAAQLTIQLENARLYSETRRRLDLLSVLNEMSRRFAGSLDAEALATTALELLTERLGADAGWVYEQRDDQLVLIGRRHRGGGEIGDGAFDTRLDLDDRNLCGRCVLAGKPLFVERESATDGPALATLAGRMRFLAAYPLIAEERLLGTLCVGRREGGRFEEEELQLLDSAASQLAAALERARLFEEKMRQVHDLSRINELGHIISQHLELPALLSVATEHLAHLVDVPQVFVLLRDPDGPILRVAASNLREPGVFDIALGPEDRSAARCAVAGMRPVVIEDAFTDPRANRNLALRFNQRSLLSVPLISRGQPIGALTLAESREGRRFSPSMVERTVAIAHQLGAAIANARLFEEERRRVRELSLLAELGRTASGTLQREVLLSESVDHIRSALAFDAGAAWVVRDGNLERIAQKADDPACTDWTALDALAQRVVATGSSAGDLLNGRLHACAVPLLAGTEVTGVIAFSRRQAPVSDAELRTLAAAAPEIGVALQNARLFDDARRRADELRLLLDVGRAITGSLDLDQILETSASVLSRFIDGSNAFIMLLDPTTRELTGAACSNAAWRDEFRTMRIGLDEHAIAANCVRTRKVELVPDVRCSPYAASERVHRFGERSIMALPLLVRDEPIGCVLVDDVRRPRAWSAAEVERAALIAHQVAVAVANARLYEGLKNSYQELARAQEELVKRERLAALGELSAVVAHEVRNPLGVIFNSLGSMRKLLRPTGDAAMLLDIVAEEADRLDRIVRDLLDFARPHEPVLAPEPVAELIADTLAGVGTDRVPEGIEVETEIPPDLPPVPVDARMIRQVLLNLVMNGMQAMPRGGTLRIRAEREEGPRPMLRIEIADEGTGVPPELAQRIFQPFFTTKATGTGLGLAVVKRFVEAHRGSIVFQSRQGYGSTFTLRLPME